MWLHFARSFRLLASALSVASSLAMLVGCSKADDGDPAAASTPTGQAQAVQSAIASARAAPDQGAAAGAPPTGMAQILGQPPMANGPSVAESLPPAPGSPHIYHLGRDTFFLDQASAIGLTREQQQRLAALKEGAAIAYENTQRKIDRGEQDLWVLTSSAAPDLAKIERRIGEIARLGGQQRIDFIRAVGLAVGVLSDAQRKAVASQGVPRQSGTMRQAPSASEMRTGGGSPPQGSTGPGGPRKMPTGMGPGGSMPPQRSEMSGMADAGSPSGVTDAESAGGMEPM